MVQNLCKNRYNDFVKQKILLFGIFILSMLASLLFPLAGVSAEKAKQPVNIPQAEVSAYELIAAMNSLRVSYGLPALIEDPIINAVAQSTAEYMAVNQMSSHIGNVSGRLAASGYGGGATVWATENFAVGNQTLDEIMAVWSDPSHMLPAVTPAYCHVGAGTAKSSNGFTYYVLQAAYISGKSCGAYTPGTSGTTGGTTSNQPGTITGGVSQMIMPVSMATADADGRVYHVVQSGQTFWSIAIAYKITIRDLKTWNNLADDAVLKAGQKLFIPGSNTAGFATPTQVGAIQLSVPDASGKVIHAVQAYQTLSTIATAYGTTVDALLSLNHIQADAPLQIGQELLVSLGNVTPGATLSAIQQLTPAEDGQYYHTVKSGETLNWIATMYGVSVSDLMAWNGLTDASIIRIEQNLLLRVTPPPTQTATVEPVTATPLPPTPTVTLPPTITPTATPAPLQAFTSGNGGLLLTAAVMLILAGVVVAVLFRQSKPAPPD